MHIFPLASSFAWYQSALLGTACLFHIPFLCIRFDIIITFWCLSSLHSLVSRLQFFVVARLFPHNGVGGAVVLFAPYTCFFVLEWNFWFFGHTRRRRLPAYVLMVCNAIGLFHFYSCHLSMAHEISVYTLNWSTRLVALLAAIRFVSMKNG